MANLLFLIPLGSQLSEVPGQFCPVMSVTLNAPTAGRAAAFPNLTISSKHPSPPSSQDGVTALTAPLLPPLWVYTFGRNPELSLWWGFRARFGGREAQGDPPGHRNAPISVQHPAWPAVPCWVRVTLQPQSHRPGCVSNLGWPAWRLGSSTSTLPRCLAFSHALISKRLWMGGLLIDAENTERCRTGLLALGG